MLHVLLPASLGVQFYYERPEQGQEGAGAQNYILRSALLQPHMGEETPRNGLKQDMFHQDDDTERLP